MAGRPNGSATPRVLDFKNVPSSPKKSKSSADSEIAEQDFFPDGHVKSKKQIRARARRMIARGAPLTEELFEAWCGKPIDRWDMEELSRGRVRDSGGTFRGRPTPVLHRAVHERIMDQFKSVVKRDMNVQAASAMGVIQNLIANNEVDDKGKPIVAPSVKLQAAQWLVEHVLGKPVQPRTDDISVRLQGILGTVMVNPILDDNHPDARAALPPGYSMGHIGTRGDYIDVDVDDDDE